MTKLTAKLVKQANHGDMITRMIAIAQYIDSRHASTALALVNTLQSHWGCKPPGFDALLNDIGSHLLCELIKVEQWTDSDLQQIAWGLPLDSLEIWGKQHLRTTDTTGA